MPASSTSWSQFTSNNYPSTTTSKAAEFARRYVRALAFGAAVSLAMLAMSAMFFGPEDTKLSLASAEVTEDGVLVDAPCKETYGVFPCSSSLTGSLFLMMVYGAIITFAAQCIGDGGEAFLELKVLPPSMIGGILLPVLGVIPDAAIIAVSCLGLSNSDAAHAERKIEVGMGTLAGSTIMLLTIAFAGSLWLGRCDLDANGAAMDGILGGKAHNAEDPDGLAALCQQSTTTGVTHDKGVLRIKWWMCLTAACYLVVQVPAAALQDPATTKSACLVGAICCAVLLVVYLIDSTVHAEDEDESPSVAMSKVEAKREHASAKYLSTLAGMIKEDKVSTEDIKTTFDQAQKGSRANFRMSLRKVSQRTTKNSRGDTATEIFDPITGEVNRFSLENVFDVFDADRSGYLDQAETDKFVKIVFMSHGEIEVPKKLQSSIKAAQRQSKGSSSGFCDGGTVPAGTLNKETFVNLVADFCEEDAKEQAEEAARELAKNRDLEQQLAKAADISSEDGVSHAMVLIIVGTVFAGAFSDAMVNAIDSFGTVSGIPNFVIGFVVCPIASNASETISSFQLASRKKTRNASVTFAQIYAACTMNNCACLGIFFFLAWKMELGWNYAAEVYSIVGVTWFVALVTMFETTIKTGLGWFVLLLYPFSLLFVEALHRMNIK